MQKVIVTKIFLFQENRCNNFCKDVPFKLETRGECRRQATAIFEKLTIMGLEGTRKNISDLRKL